VPPPNSVAKDWRNRRLLTSARPANGQCYRAWLTPDVVTLLGRASEATYCSFVGYCFAA
jgi:hypothetical protein